MSSTTQIAPARTRVAYVDNLRVWLVILVVGHHAAITYSHITAWFYYEEPHDDSATLLDVIILINQMYFMGFFFLLSGLFVARSYDRKGPGGFVRERLLRLGVPYLIFLFVLRPPTSLPQFLSRRAELGDDFSFVRFYLTVGSNGQAWFLEVLLAFSIGYAIFRLLNRAPVPDAGRVESKRLRGGWIAMLLAALIILTIGWRIVVPSGSFWMARDWPYFGLPTPSYLPQYLLMFVVGILASRRGWLDRLRAVHGWIGLAMALVAVLVGVTAVGAVVDGTLTSPIVINLITSVADSACGIGASMALTVFFRKFLNRPPKAFGKFLSQQAFTVFLIHSVVLVWWGMALQPVEAIAVVKFALLLALSLPTCWGVAWLIRKIPGATHIL